MRQGLDSPVLATAGFQGERLLQGPVAPLMKLAGAIYQQKSMQRPGDEQHRPENMLIVDFHHVAQSQDFSAQALLVSYNFLLDTQLDGLIADVIKSVPET